MSIDTKVAIIGGGIAGLAPGAQSRSAAISTAASTRRHPSSKSSASASRLLPHATREIDRARPPATRSSRSRIENVESCFFNRFGQLLYKEPRGKFAGYSYPELGIHRGRLHMALYQGGARRARPRPHRSPTGIASAIEQDDSGVTIRFTRDLDRQGRAVGRRRDRDRLRRHQLRRAQAILSRREGRLRRHQHLARRDAAQADPDRPLLYARRLDPHRQDRDLSDHRQCRRRGKSARQLDGRDPDAESREERLEQDPASSTISCRSIRTGNSIGSMSAS